MKQTEVYKTITANHVDEFETSNGCKKAKNEQIALRILIRRKSCKSHYRTRIFYYIILAIGRVTDRDK